MRRAWLFSILAFFGSASLAAAQGIDANAEARVYFEEGNRHVADAARATGRRRAEAFEAALRAYVASLRIVSSKNAVFNVAVVLEELGRHDEAFGYYTQYLAMEGLDGSERDAATERRERLRPLLAIVAVGSRPRGAAIRVDRLDLAPNGRTPLEIAVPPGAHTLHLALEGHTDLTLSIEARRGERVEVEAALEALPAEPAPATEPEPPSRGRLRVRTSDDADVFVDGEFAGLGPELAIELDAGPHRLRVEAPERRPLEETVDVAGGAELLAEVELRPRFVVDRQPRRIAWSTVGVAGGTAIGVSLAALASRQRFDRSVQRCGGCPTSVRLADETDRKNHVADAFWLATVVTGTVAVIVHRRSRHEGPPSEARFTVGVGTPGVSFAARFGGGRP